MTNEVAINLDTKVNNISDLLTQNQIDFVKNIDNKLELFAGSDKVAHFLMYLVTACIFIFDYAKFKLPHHTKLNLELLFTCCAMLLGLLMEIGQLVLSNGRTYDIVDLIANCLGAAMGFCYMHWRGLHKMRRSLVHSGHYHRHKRHRH